MERSEQLTELAPALAKAQSAIRDAEKSRVNPHLKTKYSTLSDIWEAARKPLTDNELSVVQCTIPTQDETLHLKTLLLHASGQFISSDLIVPVLKLNQAQNALQAMGTAMTYGRRYAFSCMIGICSDDDGDGDGAGKAEERPATQQRNQRATEANQKQETKTYTESVGLKERTAQDIRGSCQGLLKFLGYTGDEKAYYERVVGKALGDLDKMKSAGYLIIEAALQQAGKDKKACFALWAQVSDSDSNEDRYVCWGSYVGREIKSSSDLTPAEWAKVRETLQKQHDSVPDTDPFDKE